MAQGKKHVLTKRLEWVPLKDNPSGIGSSTTFQAQPTPTVVDNVTILQQQQQPTVQPTPTVVENVLQQQQEPTVQSSPSVEHLLSEPEGPVQRSRSTKNL